VAKTHFDWDPTKDIVNQQKHGVGFTEAQFAFATLSARSRQMHRTARKNLGSSALAKLVAAS
jgi:uncharacterized DUF497 family protein